MPDTPIPRGGRSRAEGTTTPTLPSSPQSSLEGFGKTTGDPAAAPAAPRAGRGLVLVAAAAALLAGGALAYQVTRPAPVPSPGSVDTAKAAPSSAPVDTAAKPRTVELVILPDGATVEVDGVPAAVKDGVVDITGALGSVHKVRISAGGDETTGKVVVTESGALPAKMALDPRSTTPASSAVPGPAPTLRPTGPRPGPSAQPDLRFQR
jgi:serine/threonine-protein kinase